MTISEAFEIRITVLRGEGKVEKTFKNYRCAMRSLINSIGDIPIELFGERQLAIWYMQMKQDGISDSTVRGYYQSLKGVLGYLLDNNMRVMEPRKIKAPKRDTPPKIPLPATEVQKLIDACQNPRDKALAAMVFLSGGRISSVLDLEKDQLLEAPIDETGQQEIVVRGKNKKYITLFVGPVARKYINAYLDTRRHPVTGKLDYYKPLFMSGQRRQITVSRVEQIFHKAAGYAGLTKIVTPHILRHSFTTDLLENGAPIELVSKALGHSSVAVTSRIYSHVGNKSQKEMINKFLTPIR